MILQSLENVLNDLAEALNRHGSAVLCAPPGAGKTTAVPGFLLDRCAAGKKIIMLEPRRIAARAAACRIAALAGDRAGGIAGYRTKLDTKVTSATRIEVVTEGILTRMVQDSPDLPGVGLVIFDEFHERNVQGDLALTFLLEAKRTLGLETKILVMSATLDSGRVSALLGNAPQISCEGRLFPVETVYMPRRDAFKPLEDSVRSAVVHALDKNGGDILVFLPGGAEIRRAEKVLSELQDPTLMITPLYGDLPPEAQDAAISPAPEGFRKIILATPIAETSLTIEGVRTVIDSGLRRASLFSPRNGMSRLETRKISLASAEQRRGRAGRLGPGFCIRLWSAAEEQQMRPFDPPEILDTDPVPLALELANWGTRPEEIENLPWLDSPPVPKMLPAFELLKEFGAISGDGAITPHGKKMLRTGTHPRSAHAILRSEELFHGGFTAALTGAILDERDPLAGKGCDMRDRLALVSGSRHDPLCRRIYESARKAANGAGLREPYQLKIEHCGAVLALAYPDRIGVLRPGTEGSFTLSNGTGAVFRFQDPLAKAGLIAAADVEGEGAKQTIFTAAPLDFGTLRRNQPELTEESFRTFWSDEKQAVLSEKVILIGKAVYQAKPAPADADPEEVAKALAEGIRRTGLHVLPFTKEVRNLQERVQFLRRHMPEAGFPDLSEESLMQSMEWLLPYLNGITRFEQLKRLDLHTVFSAMLTREQRNLLSSAAPEKIEVPSGSMIRLDYGTPDGIPLLPVKLQEIFGMLDTPKLAGGRVPVTVQILSPAMRPVQTTRDLRNFWQTSYFLVRKDMRGRYPKHNWPEDPLAEPPSRRSIRKPPRA